MARAIFSAAASAGSVLSAPGAAWIGAPRRGERAPGIDSRSAFMGATCNCREFHASATARREREMSGETATYVRVIRNSMLSYITYVRLLRLRITHARWARRDFEPGGRRHT